MFSALIIGVRDQTDQFNLGGGTHIFGPFARITNPCPKPCQPWKLHWADGGTRAHFWGALRTRNLFNVPVPDLVVHGDPTSTDKQKNWQAKSKLNKTQNLSEFCPIFARISAFHFCPNSYISNFFFWGGTVPPCPPSHMPMALMYSISLCKKILRLKTDWWIMLCILITHFTST